MAVFLWWRIKHVTWANTCLLLSIPVCKLSGLGAKKSINIWHSIGFSVTWLKPKGEKNPILTLFMKQLMLSTAFPPAELHTAVSTVKTPRSVNNSNMNGWSKSIWKDLFLQLIKCDDRWPSDCRVQKTPYAPVKSLVIKRMSRLQATMTCQAFPQRVSPRIYSQPAEVDMIIAIGCVVAKGVNSHGGKITCSRSHLEAEMWGFGLEGYNNIPCTGWLKQETVISHSCLEAGSARSRRGHGQVLVRAPFLAGRQQCLMWGGVWEVGEEKEGCSDPFLSTRALISSLGLRSQDFTWSSRHSSSG